VAELEIKPTAGAQARVASVIISAILITGSLIYLLTGGGRALFASKSTVYTYVPDTEGLRKSAEVRLSGIPIGKVANVELSGLVDPQRVVRIEMRIDSEFLNHIPSDSETSITADNLVGWQFVSIDEGKSPIPVHADGTLRSEPLKQAADRADLIRSLQDELRQVDDLLSQMTSDQTPVGRFVKGEAEYDRVLARIGSFDQALRSFESPTNGLSRALFSDELYTRAITYIHNADEMLAAMQRGEGANGKLFASDQQYGDFLRTLRDLRASLADMRAGKGALGSLLTDDAQYRNLRKLLAQTDAMIAALNSGESGAGQMLINAQLYESLVGSLNGLSQMLGDFREHPQKYLRYKAF
jgi:phospholipid/cholesterol/gamma-HCH transport system substrate-binding protein